MGARCADILAGLVRGMISVIMPTYNEEKVLPGTLHALFAQPGTFETIVVDGGSTDRTCAIAESFGFADRTGDDGGASLVVRQTLHKTRSPR